MPQLDFTNDRSPSSFTVTYNANVLQPQSPGTLSVISLNTHREGLEAVGHSIPPNVTYEYVCDALRASWEAWLFGEPGAIRPALQTVHRTWLQESKRRPW